MGGLALYAQVRDRIRQLIEADRLQPGDALPSEAELQSRFRVSRATVRQALAELERDGLIARRQGRGTFVAAPPIERELPELTSFSEHLRTVGLRPTSKLLGYTPIMADDRDDRRHFPAGTPLAKVVRVRLANNEPVGIHTVHVPAALATAIGFTEEAIRMDNALSLYACFDSAGVRLEWADEHLQARTATREESRLLGIGVREGTPVMNVVRLTRDENDVVVEFVRAVYLGDRYDYVVRLQRGISGFPSRGQIRTGRVTALSGRSG
jgi:GntR family transcriptional regulator